MTPLLLPLQWSFYIRIQMKKKFKEVNFVNNKPNKFQFDFVRYEDILKKTPPDHNQFEFHKLSFYAILLFSKNDGKYNLNFKDYQFKKGTLFTVRKDNIHKFYKNQGKGHLLIFTENFILNHSNQLEASKTFLLFNEMLASPKLQLNEKEFKEIMTLNNFIKEEYLKAKDDHSLSIIRSYIQIVITKLFRIKSKNELGFGNQKHLSRFLQLQKLIEKECFNHKKVSFYAQEMGVSAKTLNNVTQSILDKSAKTFINEIVIIQAKRLIINSQDSLTEIAYQLGFEDPTNFFKYYKKNTGQSPSQFRASCENSRNLSN